MYRRSIRPTIDGANADQNIFWGCFGILDEHIKVAALSKDACIDQLILWFILSAPAVGVNQIIIGIGRLRVLIEHLHIGVGRSEERRVGKECRSRCWSDHE